MTLGSDDDETPSILEHHVNEKSVICNFQKTKELKYIFEIETLANRCSNKLKLTLPQLF